MAAAVAAATIDAKPFTPHLTLKQPSPLTSLMGEGGSSQRAGSTRVKEGTPGGSQSSAHKRGRMGSVTTSQFLDPDEVSISSSDGVIVVSYFLPVIVTRVAPEDSAGSASSWVIAWDTENLLSLRTRLRVTWVGTVRVNPPPSKDEEDSLARALQKFDCVPVFIDPENHEKFYKTFCKGTLWPVFHHILDVYGPLPTR